MYRSVIHTLVFVLQSKRLILDELLHLLHLALTHFLLLGRHFSIKNRLIGGHTDDMWYVSEAPVFWSVY